MNKRYILKLKILQWNRIFVLILFLSIIFLTDINQVSAKNFTVYSDDKISLKYPSGWGLYEVPNSKTYAKLFTAPGWSLDEGGTIISYSLVSFPGSYDTLSEKNKDEYIKGVLKAIQEQQVYDKIEIVSSEIISVGNFTALMIDLDYYTKSVLIKQRMIYISDGDRFHMLTYGSKGSYEKFLPLFQETVNSFSVKNPHITPFGYVNLSNQKTYLLSLLVILFLLSIFGVYKLIKTKDTKLKHKENERFYKNIIKTANIAIWVAIIGDWVFGIKITFYLFVVSVFSILICSIILLDTKERKYVKSNLYFVIFLIIASLIGYFIGFISP